MYPGMLYVHSCKNHCCSGSIEHQPHICYMYILIRSIHLNSWLNAGLNLGLEWSPQFRHEFILNLHTITDVVWYTFMSCVQGTLQIKHINSITTHQHTAHPHEAVSSKYTSSPVFFVPGYSCACICTTRFNTAG